MSPITTDELKSVGVIDQEHAIHEYAFGIISSDDKGIPTVVSISEPYKKFFEESPSESKEEDLLNSVGFQSWSMSRYQSLYHSPSFPEDEEEGDEAETMEDSNNNQIRRGSAATEAIPICPEYRRHSLKTGSSVNQFQRLSSSNSPPTKMSVPSLRRRWSFGGTKASPPPIRFLPVDPELDLPPSPPESWISSLTNIPDKIRQHMADKNRFNLNSVPREKLKQLYCY